MSDSSSGSNSSSSDDGIFTKHVDFKTRATSSTTRPTATSSASRPTTTSTTTGTSWVSESRSPTIHEAPPLTSACVRVPQPAATVIAAATTPSHSGSSGNNSKSGLSLAALEAVAGAAAAPATQRSTSTDTEYSNNSKASQEAEERRKLRRRRRVVGGTRPPLHKNPLKDAVGGGDAADEPTGSLVPFATLPSPKAAYGARDAPPSSAGGWGRRRSTVHSASTGDLVTASSLTSASHNLANVPVTTASVPPPGGAVSPFSLRRKHPRTVGSSSMHGHSPAAFAPASAGVAAHLLSDEAYLDAFKIPALMAQLSLSLMAAKPVDLRAFTRDWLADRLVSEEDEDDDDGSTFGDRDSVLPASAAATTALSPERQSCPSFGALGSSSVNSADIDRVSSQLIASAVSLEPDAWPVGSVNVRAGIDAPYAVSVPDTKSAEGGDTDVTTSAFTTRETSPEAAVSSAAEQGGGGSVAAAAVGMQSGERPTLLGVLSSANTAARKAGERHASSRRRKGGGAAAGDSKERKRRRKAEAGRGSGSGSGAGSGGNSGSASRTPAGKRKSARLVGSGAGGRPRKAVEISALESAAASSTSSAGAPATTAAAAAAAATTTVDSSSSSPPASASGITFAVPCGGGNAGSSNKSSPNASIMKTMPPCGAVPMTEEEQGELKQKLADIAEAVSAHEAEAAEKPSVEASKLEEAKVSSATEAQKMQESRKEAPRTEQMADDHPPASPSSSSSSSSSSSGSHDDLWARVELPSSSPATAASPTVSDGGAHRGVDTESHGTNLDGHHRCLTSSEELPLPLLVRDNADGDDADSHASRSYSHHFPHHDATASSTGVGNVSNTTDLTCVSSSADGRSTAEVDNLVSPLHRQMTCEPLPSVPGANGSSVATTPMLSSAALTPEGGPAPPPPDFVPIHLPAAPTPTLQTAQQQQQQQRTLAQSGRESSSKHASLPSSNFRSPMSTVPEYSINPSSCASEHGDNNASPHTTAEEHARGSRRTSAKAGGDAATNATAAFSANRSSSSSEGDDNASFALFAPILTVDSTTREVIDNRGGAGAAAAAGGGPFSGFPSSAHMPNAGIGRMVTPPVQGAASLGGYYTNNLGGPPITSGGGISLSTPSSTPAHLHAQTHASGVTGSATPFPPYPPRASPTAFSVLPTPLLSDMVTPSGTTNSSFNRRGVQNGSFGRRTGGGGVSPAAAAANAVLARHADASSISPASSSPTPTPFLTPHDAMKGFGGMRSNWGSSASLPPGGAAGVGGGLSMLSQPAAAHTTGHVGLTHRTQGGGAMGGLVTPANPNNSGSIPSAMAGSASQSGGVALVGAPTAPVHAAIPFEGGLSLAAHVAAAAAASAPPVGLHDGTCTSGSPLSDILGSPPTAANGSAATASPLMSAMKVESARRLGKLMDQLPPSKYAAAIVFLEGLLSSSANSDCVDGSSSDVISTTTTIGAASSRNLGGLFHMPGTPVAEHPASSLALSAKITSPLVNVDGAGGAGAGGTRGWSMPRRAESSPLGGMPARGVSSFSDLLYGGGVGGASGASGVSGGSGVGSRGLGSGTSAVPFTGLAGTANTAGGGDGGSEEGLESGSTTLSGAAKTGGSSSVEAIVRDALSQSILRTLPQSHSATDNTAAATATSIVSGGGVHAAGTSRAGTVTSGLSLRSDRAMAVSASADGAGRRMPARATTVSSVQLDSGGSTETEARGTGVAAAMAASAAAGGGGAAAGLEHATTPAANTHGTIFGQPSALAPPSSAHLGGGGQPLSFYKRPSGNDLSSLCPNSRMPGAAPPPVKSTTTGAGASTEPLVLRGSPIPSGGDESHHSSVPHSDLEAVSVVFASALTPATPDDIATPVRPATMPPSPVANLHQGPHSTPETRFAASTVEGSAGPVADSCVSTRTEAAAAAAGGGGGGAAKEDDAAPTPNPSTTQVTAVPDALGSDAEEKQAEEETASHLTRVENANTDTSPDWPQPLLLEKLRSDYEPAAEAASPPPKEAVAVQKVGEGQEQEAASVEAGKSQNDSVSPPTLDMALPASSPLLPDGDSPPPPPLPSAQTSTAATAGAPAAATSTSPNNTSSSTDGSTTLPAGLTGSHNYKPKPPTHSDDDDNEDMQARDSSHSGNAPRPPVASQRLPAVVNTTSTTTASVSGAHTPLEITTSSSSPMHFSDPARPLTGLGSFATIGNNSSIAEGSSSRTTNRTRRRSHHRTSQSLLMRSRAHSYNSSSLDPLAVPYGGGSVGASFASAARRRSNHRSRRSSRRGPSMSFLQDGDTYGSPDGVSGGAAFMGSPPPPPLTGPTVAEASNHNSASAGGGNADFHDMRDELSGGPVGSPADLLRSAYVDDLDFGATLRTAVVMAATTGSSFPPTHSSTHPRDSVEDTAGSPLGTMMVTPSSSLMPETPSSGAGGFGSGGGSVGAGLMASGSRLDRNTTSSSQGSPAPQHTVPQYRSSGGNRSSAASSYTHNSSTAALGDAGQSFSLAATMGAGSTSPSTAMLSPATPQLMTTTPTQSPSSEPVAVASSVAVAMNSFFSREDHVAPEELEVVREAVSHYDAFAALDETQLETLVRTMSRVEVQRGQMVVREGESTLDRLLLVVSGKLSASRKGVVNRSLARGQFYGEMEMSYHVERSRVTLTATTPTILYALTKVDYQKLVIHEKDARRYMFLQYVNRCNLFKGLSPPAKMRLADSFRVCRLRKGAKLTEQGTAVQWMYLLMSGNVRMTCKPPPNPADSFSGIKKSLTADGDIAGAVAAASHSVVDFLSSNNTTTSATGDTMAQASASSTTGGGGGGPKSSSRHGAGGSLVSPPFTPFHRPSALTLTPEGKSGTGVQELLQLAESNANTAEARKNSGSYIASPLHTPGLYPSQLHQQQQQRVGSASRDFNNSSSGHIRTSQLFSGNGEPLAETFTTTVATLEKTASSTQSEDHSVGDGSRRPRRLHHLHSHHHSHTHNPQSSYHNSSHNQDAAGNSQSKSPGTGQPTLDQHGLASLASTTGSLDGNGGLRCASPSPSTISANAKRSFTSPVAASAGSPLPMHSAAGLSPAEAAGGSSVHNNSSFRAEKPIVVVDRMKGQLVGEPEFVFKCRGLFTAVATTPVQAARISRLHFEAIMGRTVVEEMKRNMLVNPDYYYFESTVPEELKRDMRRLLFRLSVGASTKRHSRVPQQQRHRDKDDGSATKSGTHSRAGGGGGDSHRAPGSHHGSSRAGGGGYAGKRRQTRQRPSMGFPTPKLTNVQQPDKRVSYDSGGLLMSPTSPHSPTSVNSPTYPRPPRAVRVRAGTVGDIPSALGVDDHGNVSTTRHPHQHQSRQRARRHRTAPLEASPTPNAEERDGDRSPAEAFESLEPEGAGKSSTHFLAAPSVSGTLPNRSSSSGAEMTPTTGEEPGNRAAMGASSASARANTGGGTTGTVVTSGNTRRSRNVGRRETAVDGFAYSAKHSSTGGSRGRRISARGEIVFSGSRNLYRFTADAMNLNQSIVIAVVVDGTIIRWNAVAQSVTGYAPLEAIGKSIYDFIASEEGRQHMRDLLAVAAHYAGKWEQYTAQNLQENRVFPFRQNTGLYQVGLALSAVPSNNLKTAEVLLLVGREGKYRAANTYASDVAKWLEGSLKPQLRQFQRRMFQIESHGWRVTSEDALQVKGNLDACLSMVEQFTKFSLLNMEAVNESWRPVRLPALLRRFAVEATAFARQRQHEYYCNIDLVEPKTDIFFDAPQMLAILRLLLADAFNSPNTDAEGHPVVVHAELRVTVVEPQDQGPGNGAGSSPARMNLGSFGAAIPTSLLPSMAGIGGGGGTNPNSFARNAVTPGLGMPSTGVVAGNTTNSHTSNVPPSNSPSFTPSLLLGPLSLHTHGPLGTEPLPGIASLHHTHMQRQHSEHNSHSVSDPPTSGGAGAANSVSGDDASAAGSLAMSVGAIAEGSASATATAAALATKGASTPLSINSSAATAAAAGTTSTVASSLHGGGRTNVGSFGGGFVGGGGAAASVASPNTAVANSLSSSLRRIRFELRDDGPTIPLLRSPEAVATESVRTADTASRSDAHSVPVTSPASSMNVSAGEAAARLDQSRRSSGMATAAAVIAAAASAFRGAELQHVEKILSNLGGVIYGFTRPEAAGNVVRVELPLLAVPGASEEGREEENGMTTGGAAPLSSGSRTFTVIVADNNRMHQQQLCQILWARQHAVVPVTSFREVVRKLEMNTADILLIDPLQLDIASEDYESLLGDDPFDEIRIMSARLALVVMTSDFSDWRVQKLLNRHAVVELPKVGSGALVHIAMQEAEQLVTEMRDEEERIDLIRRTFTNCSAERHKVGKRIGKGAFGDVYEVEDTLTGGKMAMKQMRLHDGLLADEVVQEILAMTLLKHENIIQYFYCEKESDTLLRLYMELAPGGTLRDRIREHTGVGLPFDEIVHHLADICHGLAYVHEQNYVHGDLKTANLLLGTRGRTKIGDFGTAKHLGPHQLLYTMVGTPQYMAPEVLTADVEEGVGYDFKADIWSLGCIVLEMATGSPPFAHLEYAQGMGIIKYLTELTDTPDLSPLFSGNPLVYEFVKSCLDVDPLNRPTAQELLHFDILEGAVASQRAERLVKRAEMLYKLNKYAAMRADGGGDASLGGGGNGSTTNAGSVNSASRDGGDHNGPDASGLLFSETDDDHDSNATEDYYYDYDDDDAEDDEETSDESFDSTDEEDEEDEYTDEEYETESSYNSVEDAEQHNAEEGDVAGGDEGEERQRHSERNSQSLEMPEDMHRVHFGMYQPMSPLSLTETQLPTKPSPPLATPTEVHKLEAEVPASPPMQPAATEGNVLPLQSDSQQQALPADHEPSSPQQ